MPSFNTCASCFGDASPIGYQTEEPQVGACTLCANGTDDVWPATAWADPFQQVTDLYRPTDQSGSPLHVRIQDDWSLFASHRTPQQNRSFLEAVFPDGHQLLDAVAVEPVNGTNVDNYSRVWDDFANDLVKRNRFFPSGAIDPLVLEHVIGRSLRRIHAGTRFYRGRISPDGSAIPRGKMGMPPAIWATGGRANPPGIPHLYLAFHEDTCIAEIRPSTHSTLTLAAFETTDEVTFLDLSAIQPLNPFGLEDDEFSQLYSYKLLKRLGLELSKPVRRSDNGVEYAASQYICEFVKSIGIEGIKYASSVHPGGQNLVLFNDKKVQVTGKLTTYEIVGATYATKAKTTTR
ncbi:RES family NAD+ phosphorylase [Arthrobacter sp. EPSL27]|uniref:RES family NAD+ phosphorylase n=1 Tax=Arthrobacter sp. EPSL27 TaxID=1745378 RepID=UPI000B1BBB0D|nr:RES family NAD+ phosphorylase [Arthrobacter sp. EPSL27]